MSPPWPGAAAAAVMVEEGHPLSSPEIRRFTTAQAARACRMTQNSLALMLNTRAIALTNDMSPQDRNPGFGNPRTLSLRCVLHLALVAELSRVGLPQASASRLALQFSDSAAVDFPRDEPASRTVFRVLYPSMGGAPVAEVDYLGAMQASVMDAGLGPCIATLLIDLDALQARARAALGLTDQ